MCLWKIISDPFYPKNSSNGGEINDIELKSQLEELTIKGLKWEIIELIAVRRRYGKLFDFVIHTKYEVVSLPILKIGFYPK